MHQKPINSVSSNKELSRRENTDSDDCDILDGDHGACLERA